MNLHELTLILQTKGTKTTGAFKNMNNLVVKLMELESMIGLGTVKESFVMQITLILLSKNYGHKPPFKKMHTILSGPPGVGKTTLSVLLAEIWTLLDIMNKDTPYSPFFVKEKKKNPDVGPLFSLASCHEDRVLKKADSVVKNHLLTLVTSITDGLTENMLAIERSSCTDQDFLKQLYSRSEKSLEVCDQILNLRSDVIVSDIAVDTSKDLPYVILGREDFVGTYQGHTSVKTKEILDANRGKIIIIEEAYLLSTDERDSYGMEALTLINRYMDEYVNDYIFIFNGYTDQLNKTIFKSQPGLKRRIQWTFEIEPYTGEEMYEIFIHQFSRYKQWSLAEKDKGALKDFFVKNKDFFPHFGGDTERLITHCQLVYAQKQYSSDEEPNFSIGISDIKKAFSFYKKSSDATSMPRPSSKDSLISRIYT